MMPGREVAARAVPGATFVRVRALLSVYDKRGIVELASRLHELGVDLVSSGGTASVIAEADIPVTDVADVTGFPPMLGHRDVTLHPRIHGGILADRRDSAHLRDLETHHLDLIDIVIGNLYPFESKPSIDLIDIGGPTLLRAAAKNHEYVTVLVDPADYPAVLDALANGGTTPGLRHRLARKAFAHTAAYDAAIARWFIQDARLVGTQRHSNSDLVATLSHERRHHPEDPHRHQHDTHDADAEKLGKDQQHPVSPSPDPASASSSAQDVCCPCHGRTIPW